MRFAFAEWGRFRRAQAAGVSRMATHKKTREKAADLRPEGSRNPHPIPDAFGSHR